VRYGHAAGKNNSHMTTQTIRISGMHCDACIKLITRFFSRIPGVSVIRVENGVAQVTAETAKTISDFQGALAGTEYTVVGIS
jgi:copper chaperone CopZ